MTEKQRKKWKVIGSRNYGLLTELTHEGADAFIRSGAYNIRLDADLEDIFIIGNKGIFDISVDEIVEEIKYIKYQPQSYEDDDYYYDDYDDDDVLCSRNKDDYLSEIDDVICDDDDDECIDKKKTKKKSKKKSKRTKRMKKIKRVMPIINLPFIPYED